MYIGYFGHDDLLIKLAAIVQRLASSQTSVDTEGGFVLSDDERKALFAEADVITKELNKPIEAITPS